MKKNASTVSLLYHSIKSKSIPPLLPFGDMSRRHLVKTVSVLSTTLRSSIQKEKIKQKGRIAELPGAVATYPSPTLSCGFS